MKAAQHFATIADRVQVLQTRSESELEELKNLLHENLGTGNKSAYLGVLSNRSDLLYTLKLYGISTAIGFTAGYVANKIVFGFSPNPVKRVLGGVIQYMLTTVVARQIRIEARK